LDEEQYIDIMLSKAQEFINSPVILEKAKNFNSLSHSERAAYINLELAFDHHSQNWEKFDLSKYVINQKLVLPQ